MASAPSIPNEFVPCEEYRGHVIAIRDQRYYIFGGGLPGRSAGGSTRAEARRRIDGWWRNADRSDSDARADERRMLGDAA